MSISTTTQLCGVLGDPVEHSLSPAIHNAAFRHLNLDFVYLAFRLNADDVEGAMQGIRALGNIRGFSVTIPHKVAVMPYLDEIEPAARHIGCVNTILKDQGRLIGRNTDASGALQALEQGGAHLAGSRVALLGSGGAARAIAFGLAMRGDLAGLTILGIDEAERSALVCDVRERTNCEVAEGDLKESTLARVTAASQVLVHCTPIGMHPRVSERCVPTSVLHPELTVMDVVYNPLVTQLLRDAADAGCRTIRGVEMFVNQAVGQFEWWTGQSAPVDVMRSMLERQFQ